jgi:nucleoside-diphosphate-sugar epimerase
MEFEIRILITGGAGDLGQTLAPLLLARGDTPVLLDVRPPRLAPLGATIIQGSILNRPLLTDWLRRIDTIVHIAGWHGIHEDSGEKSAYDFFDLNVRGTFEVFQAAATVGIDKIVHISTTSVRRPDTLYGRSKILGERIAADFATHGGMNVITLRPRGFIPYWNRSVYTKYSDWARWFWKGAVHIDDVAQAVLLSLDLLFRERLGRNPVLPLDSAYEYSEDDLANWDADGPGSTFRKYYPDRFDLALSYGLDPAAKPFRLDISETQRMLGYQPRYSLASLLTELARYGDAGPPHPLSAP